MEFPRALSDDDPFYRAIRNLHIKPDGRISPGAFSKTTGTNRMSVDWAQKSTPEITLARFECWPDRKAVVSITAKVCWDRSQSLDFKPLPDNPSHSEVVGPPSNSLRKHLARNARLIYELS